MDAGVRRTLFWLVAFICLILGLFLSNFLAPRGLTPEQQQQLGYYEFPSPRSLQSFSLIDQSRNPVTQQAFEGHWTLVFFGFTYCPDVCPTTLGVLSRAVDRMDQPPAVVMVSVDPERDTPEALAQYVSSFSPEFRGFTGEFEEVVSLATQLNVAFGKVPGPEIGTYLVDHATSIAVINPRAEYVGFIKAPHAEQNIAQLMQDISDHD